MTIKKSLIKIIAVMLSVVIPASTVITSFASTSIMSQPNSTTQNSINELIKFRDDTLKSLGITNTKRVLSITSKHLKELEDYNISLQKKFETKIQKLDLSNKNINALISSLQASLDKEYLKKKSQIAKRYSNDVTVQDIDDAFRLKDALEETAQYNINETQPSSGASIPRAASTSKTWSGLITFKDTQKNIELPVKLLMQKNKIITITTYENGQTKTIKPNSYDSPYMIAMKSTTSTFPAFGLGTWLISAHYKGDKISGAFLWQRLQTPRFTSTALINLTLGDTAFTENVTLAKITKSFYDGIKTGAKESGMELYDAVINPIETVKQFGDSIVMLAKAVFIPTSPERAALKALMVNFCSEVKKLLESEAVKQAFTAGKILAIVIIQTMGSEGSGMLLKVLKESKVLAKLLVSIVPDKEALRLLIVGDKVAEAIKNAKFTRILLQSLRGFMDDVAVIVERNGLTMDRFNALRSKSASLLTNAEKTSMKAIRDSVPMLTEDTVIQKVISKGDIQKYIDGAYSPQVRGYVSKAQDTKQLSNYDDIYNSLKLDYEGTAFNKISDDSMGVIRFKSASASTGKVPYSAEMGGTVVDGAPFTGNGFTAATNGQAIPEFKFENWISMQDGAEIYQVTKNGTEILKAVYNYKLGKFIPVN